MNLRVGDWVRVRSEEEIRRTLDESGCLDGLPFMPQMLQSCGQRFRVSKRAHKMCDPSGGPLPRRMQEAVFLEELRCDGDAYGGCEMQCRIIWKEAWLERIDESSESDVEKATRHHRNNDGGALEELVSRNSKRRSTSANGEPTWEYRCQATRIPAATTPLARLDFVQYVEDLRYGNATVREVVRAICLEVFEQSAVLGIGLGSFMRWSWDRLHGLVNGPPYPYRRGRLPNGSRTPTANLGLAPGDLVRIKTYEEIRNTITEDLSNRGLTFSAEMVPYCGQTMQVSKRLTRVINEKTGHLIELKNPCLVLDGAVCTGLYARPFMCPRGLPPYWREIWLERVEQARSSEVQARP